MVFGHMTGPRELLGYMKVLLTLLQWKTLESQIKLVM